MILHECVLNISSCCKPKAGGEAIAWFFGSLVASSSIRWQSETAGLIEQSGTHTKDCTSWLGGFILLLL